MFFSYFTDACLRKLMTSTQKDDHESILYNNVKFYLVKTLSDIQSFPQNTVKVARQVVLDFCFADIFSFVQEAVSYEVLR